MSPPLYFLNSSFFIRLKPSILTDESRRPRPGESPSPPRRAASTTVTKTGTHSENPDEGRKAFLLRISPDLWKEVEAWAQSELRSVNGQVEYLLRQAVNQRKKTK